MRQEYRDILPACVYVLRAQERVGFTHKVNGSNFKFNQG